MKYSRILPILTLLLTVAALAPAADMAQLDADLKVIATVKGGENDQAIKRVEAVVVAAATDAKQRAAVELRLLATLDAPATPTSRDFVCRQLRTIGTARSIPKLEAMLVDPKTSNVARYALGRFDDPAADAALCRALAKTSGIARVGIISTLGNRRCHAAMLDMVKLLAAPDVVTAVAAARAVGMIGGHDAVKALSSAPPSSSDARESAIADALLRCAEGFCRDGQKNAAAGIYEAFYKSDRPKYLRIGALRGLVATRGADAAPLLVAAIKGDDPEFRASAIVFMAMGGDAKATKVFMDLLVELKPDGQELVLCALGHRGDASAMPAIVKYAGNDNAAVRTAALAALGGLGDASTVALLSKAIATDNATAVASLLRLRGDGVDAAILRDASTGPSATRVEMIRILASRRSAGAVGPLMKMAREGDHAVRAEAIRSLGALISQDDLPAMVDLMVKPGDPGDRATVDQAIATALNRVADRDALTDPVLAALGDAKPVLVALLGRAGTPKALAAVRKATASDDAIVKDAAIRTLALWPNATPAGELLPLAKTLDSRVHKVLLLRGYIRMAARAKNANVMYAEAMAFAESANDKKLVLGGIGSAGGADAIKLAQPLLKDEQLRREAALAMNAIAGRIRRGQPAAARAALEAVLAAVKDTRIRTTSERMLKSLPGAK